MTDSGSESDEEVPLLTAVALSLELAQKKKDQQAVESTSSSFFKVLYSTSCTSTMICQAGCSSATKQNILLTPQDTCDVLFALCMLKI